MLSLYTFIKIKHKKDNKKNNTLQYICIYIYKNLIVFLEESTCGAAAGVFGAELGADTVGHLEGGGGQAAGRGEEAGLARQVVAVVGAAVEDLVVPVEVVLRKVRVLVHEAPECVCGGVGGGEVATGGCQRQDGTHVKKTKEGRRRGMVS